jgi:hypothetical protein
MTGLDPVVFFPSEKDARVKRGHDEKSEERLP